MTQSTEHVCQPHDLAFSCSPSPGTTLLPIQKPQLPRQKKKIILSGPDTRLRVAWVWRWMKGVKTVNQLCSNLKDVDHQQLIAAPEFAHCELKKKQYLPCSFFRLQEMLQSPASFLSVALLFSRDNPGPIPSHRIHLSPIGGLESLAAARSLPL